MTNLKTDFTFLCLLTICLLYSCKEELPPETRPVITICGVENALIETSWLEAMTSSGMPDNISTYTYLGDTVLSISYCESCADGSVAVYNCAGESICTLTGFAGPDGGCPEWSTEAELIEVNWEE